MGTESEYPTGGLPEGIRCPVCDLPVESPPDRYAIHAGIVYHLYCFEVIEMTADNGEKNPMGDG